MKNLFKLGLMLCFIFVFGACNKEKNESFDFNNSKNNLELLNGNVFYLDGNEMDQELLSQLGIEYIIPIDNDLILNLVNSFELDYKINDALIFGAKNGESIVLQSMENENKYILWN